MPVAEASFLRLSHALTAAKVEHRFWASTRMLKNDWDGPSLSSIWLFPNTSSSLRRILPTSFLIATTDQAPESSKIHNMFLYWKKSCGRDAWKSKPTSSSGKLPRPLTVGQHQKTQGVQIEIQRAWPPNVSTIRQIIAGSSTKPANQGQSNHHRPTRFSPWRAHGWSIWSPPGTWGTGAAAGHSGSRGRPRGHRAPELRLGDARGRWGTSRWCHRRGDCCASFCGNSRHLHSKRQSPVNNQSCSRSGLTKFGSPSRLGVLQVSSWPRLRRNLVSLLNGQNYSHTSRTTLHSSTRPHIFPWSAPLRQQTFFLSSDEFPQHRCWGSLPTAERRPCSAEGWEKTGEAVLGASGFKVHRVIHTARIQC